MSVPIQEFSKYYTTSLKISLPDLNKQEPRLRVSGFPFCALKHAYLKMIGHVEPDGDSFKEYYTSVGTAAHEVFQRWLGAKGRIYGDWSCPSCKTVTKFSSNNTCSKCKSEMKYEEFTVTAFKHVSGHTDGLFEDSNGEFWVIDYKTSSVRVIESQKFKSTLPYVKNKHQIMSYVPMIESLLKIKVAGWLLIYCARDNPQIHKVIGSRVSSQKKKRILEKIELYDQQYEEILHLKSLSQIKFLHDTKFCADYEHYEEHMKGFSGCPLESVCFTSSLKPLLKTTFLEYKNCKTS
jgi:hypothetical protein